MKEFLNYLTHYLKGPSPTIPFTYSSFIKSRFCDIMSTGLALEIADIDYSDDREKVEHFLASPNWDYYVNVCNQYGFIIDKQYPFRLVADINSTIMKNLARGQVRGGGYALLDILYTPAAQLYLQHIMSDLIQLYNLSTNEYYVETTVCPNGAPRHILKKTPRYNMRTFFGEIDLNDVLIFYMTTRINEQKPQMPEIERHNLIKDSLSFYNHGGALGRVLAVFETIVSSTLDKIGSFEYYKKHVDDFLTQFSGREGEQQQEADLDFPTLGHEADLDGPRGGGY
jgi:hypothetical protein